MIAASPRPERSAGKGTEQMLPKERGYCWKRPAWDRTASRSWGQRRRSLPEFLFCLLHRHLCLSPAVANMKTKLRPQLVSFKGLRSLGFQLNVNDAACALKETRSSSLLQLPQVE